MKALAYMGLWTGVCLVPATALWAQDAQDDKYAPVEDFESVTPEYESRHEGEPESESESETEPVQKLDKYAPITQAASAGHQSPAETGALKLDWGGLLSSSLQYRLADKSTGPYYDLREQPEEVARWENTLKVKIEALTGRFRGVVDIDFDWLDHGGLRDRDFANLTRRQDMFPVRLEAHSLYVEAVDLGLEGLDLRVGQQLVQWGMADQFNPTNSLNPEYLENVLLYGHQSANMMMRADYGFGDQGALSFVVVPVFKPSILPNSALVALSAVDRLPFIDEKTRLLLHSERELGASLGTVTQVSQMQVEMPEFSLQNMQGMARLGANVWGQDIALSYYYGRSDMPLPIKNHTVQETLETKVCNANNSAQCHDGLLGNTVTLGFPRVQVVGLNMAGELPLRWGYRLEVGLYFPEALRTTITTSGVTLLGGEQPAGEYDYVTADDLAPLVVDDDAFMKWTLGLDYSIGRHLYVNLMWVHGLADEFGGLGLLDAGQGIRQGGVSDDAFLLGCYGARDGSACAYEYLRSPLGDYGVLGADIRFDDSRGLFRLFAIVDLSGYEKRSWDSASGERQVESFRPWSGGGYSVVLYPELRYNFGQGLRLGAGALLNLGKTYTKFGDPASGGSLAFVNAVYGF
jgi:hypothetical protein